MHSKRWWVLAAVLLAFLPIVIDTTILHIAVPSLTQALGASGNELLWIIDIYPLMMAGLLVPMGTLSDRVGQRRMLLVGLLVFLAASMAAAFAPSAMALIAARAFLAVGGAMVIPSVLAVIRNVFEDPKERGVALGLWGTVSSAGAAMGPIAGGFLLEHFWWGSVFLVNLPIVLLLWPFVYRTVPEFRAERPGSWKIGHALVLIAGLILTVYGLKSAAGGKAEWYVCAAAMGLGVALVWRFVSLQRASAEPMLDLGLFRKPAIAIGVVVAMVVCGALSGVELTIAQELQYVIGKSPLEAGVFMLPLIVAAALGGPFAGWAVSKIGLRALMSLSLAISAVSLFGLGFADFHTDRVVVTVYFILLGLALSMGLTGSSIAIMNSVDETKAGAAGSLEGTGYELGVGLGIAVFGGILSGVYRSAIELPAGVSRDAVYSIGETFQIASTLPPELADLVRAAGGAAFVEAHQVVLWVAAAVIAGMAGLVCFVLRDAKSQSPEGGRVHGA
jgi:DHA2 family multidrug resistance protein-like MFS transporter